METGLLGGAVGILVIAGVVVFVILLFVFIVLVAMIASRRKKKRAAAWAVLAEKLGLQLKPGRTPGTHIMVGEYRGQKVQIETFERGGLDGDTTDTCTQVAAYFPQPAGLGLHICKEGFIEKLGKAAGGQDIEVGDPAFDGALVVRGNDPAAVQAFLGPELRAAILALIESNPNVNFNDYGAAVDIHGWVTDEAALVSWLDQLVKPVAAAGGSGGDSAG